MAGELDVVVLEKRDARLLPSESDDARGDVLSLLVGGMRLAGEEELHRVLGALDELGQPGPVLEYQVGPLVRGEAAAEAEGESVDVEVGRILRPGPRHREETALQLEMCGPELLGGNLEDRLPAAVPAVKVPPVGADVAAQQRTDLRRQPSWHVDSVRDGADRYLHLRQPSPCVLPQPARHRAMEAANSNCLVREPQGGISGAQPLSGVARALPAKVHEPVERDPDLGEVWMKEVPDQARLEVVAACCDRRVCGEDDSCPRDEPRLFERHPARGAEFADPFDRTQEAVAFVEVEDARHHAQRAQCAHTAHAEHYLLAQPAVWLWDVKPIGDRAQVGRVGLEIGVEEE